MCVGKRRGKEAEVGWLHISLHALDLGDQNTKDILDVMRQSIGK